MNPALVYVISHRELDAIKIGITGEESARIDRYTRRGWQRFKTMRFPVGSRAQEVERAVLAHVRTQLCLSQHLAPEHMGTHRGFTETFCLSELPPRAAWDLVVRFATQPS